MLMVLGIIAAPRNAAAALAANYERLRELQAVLGSPELDRALGSRVIDSIEAQALHVYRVRAGNCAVVVTLVAAPNAPPIAGPWRFTIQVGDLQCR